METSITLEEKRAIQLNMLVELDSICRTHNLTYSLAYGTLLGAIRHQGFIPWDDDMDIMMPLDDIMRLKQILRSDIIQYVDSDTDSSYAMYFPRIAHKLTYQKTGIIATSHGVCIDLYPIIPITDDRRELVHFLAKTKRLAKKFDELSKWRSRIIRRVPVKTIPLFYRYMRAVRDFVYSSKKVGSNNFFSFDGIFDLRAYHTIDLFNSMIKVKFEGYEFPSTAVYHTYLTQVYGDYMKLPPEEERVPYHGGRYYWKDK